MHFSQNLTTLEKRIGYTFQDKDLLQGALNHPSAGGKLFQRLEFLGDRVLGVVMACWLYDFFPHEEEGDLAKRLAYMVKRETLTKVAKDIDLSLCISYDGCPSYQGRIMGDTCEALIGAMYLDGGIDPVTRVVKKLWEPFLSHQETPPIDAKSALQEYLQSQKKGLPVYKDFSQKGPSHCPIFQIELVINESERFVGEGKSKRQAEQQAAQKALAYHRIPPFSTPE